MGRKCFFLPNLPCCLSGTGVAAPRHPCTPCPAAPLLAAALALPAIARAEAPWPERPIRWIVNFPPGGAADTLSRALGESIGGRLGQPIVIENRPGAGGLVGADLVAKARGDTHMVIMSNAASHGIGPVLYPNMPYDPMADFTHIALVGTFASVLVVNPGVPAQDIAEFLAMARDRPGGLAYGTGGNGTMNHLVGQLLARAAGVELTHVPYRGSAPALADAIGGQIPAVMESLPIALPHLRAGRLRALGDLRGDARRGVAGGADLRRGRLPRGAEHQLVRLLGRRRHPAGDRRPLGHGDRRGAGGSEAARALRHYRRGARGDGRRRPIPR